jgi:hypothetical protein
MSENVAPRSWLTICVGSVKDFCAVAYRLQFEMPGAVVRMLRGKNMADSRGLFNEFAAALQFPCYFGNNWNAFDECVADLEWMPGNGYLLLIVDGGHVLRDEPQDRATFFRIMRSVGKEWAEQRGLRFQTIVQCSDDEVETLRHVWEEPLDSVIRVSELKSFMNAAQPSPGPQS